jgi:hypothetical protein
MTILGCWGEKNKQRQRQQQISPLRRQNAPPSVEMTGFGWGRTINDNCNGKGNSGFLHCGGKCAAFGRNDGVWVRDNL